MKTGEIAKSLGLHPKTITLWVERKEFAGLFSPGAMKEIGKAQREFNLEDQIVLNTIRFLRNEQGITGWDDIANQIAGGYRQTSMPADYFVTETTTPIKAYTSLLEVKNQLDDAINERDRLREELDNEREDRRKTESELNREIGRLEAELYFFKNQLSKNT